MKTNRWLKALALAMTVFVMMTAIAIPAFADDEIVDPYADYSKWDGVTYTDPFDVDGDGTADVAANNSGSACVLPDGVDAIIIDSAAKLAGLAKAVNDAAVSGDWGAYKGVPIYVTVNIDLCGHEFQAIGHDYGKAMFSGEFEGRLNGVEGAAVTIANLYNPYAAANNTGGLVGNLRGGTVKNFTLVNAVVGNTNYAGACGIVVGYASKVCELTNLKAIDSTLVVTSKTGTVSAGGVIGTIKADNELVMKDMAAINVTFECPNTVTTFMGGIVGWTQARHPYTFENCYASIQLVSTQPNTMGNVILADVFAGGILGDAKADKIAPVITMKNCQFNGLLFSAAALDQSEERVGAFGSFVANIASGSLTLENCLSTGANIDAALAGNVAAGVTVTLNNVYAVYDEEAAFAGTYDDAALSFTTVATEDMEAEDLMAAAVGAGAATTFANLDFENTWKTADECWPSLKYVEDPTWLTVTVIEPDDPTVDPDDPTVDPDDPTVDPDDPTVDPDDPTVDPDDPTVDPDDPTVDPDDPTVDKEDDKKEDTTTTAPADDKKEEPKKGCFGVISSTAMVALLTLGLGVTVIRKKED